MVHLRDLQYSGTFFFYFFAPSLRYTYTVVPRRVLHRRAPYIIYSYIYIAAVSRYGMRRVRYTPHCVYNINNLRCFTLL